MLLSYVPPVLKNFGKKQAYRRYRTPQDKWRAEHVGEFLLAAQGDVVRVYALAGAFTHMQVHEECNAEGFILGGGQIAVDEEKRRISVSYQSRDFGSLPNKVLEDYFRSFDYSIKADMAEGWMKDSTRKWFRQHGIDV